MINEIANMEDEIDHDDELPGSDAEPGSAERAKRLRQAVKLAGGGSAIARRIQMPLGTLSRYQRGREMKAGAMIALAEATGVRLEWLATGAGPMRAGELQAEPAPATPPEPARPFRLFGQVKIDRLVRAYEGALASTGGADNRLIMHFSVLLYDQLSEVEERTPTAPLTSS